MLPATSSLLPLCHPGVDAEKRLLPFIGRHSGIKWWGKVIHAHLRLRLTGCRGWRRCIPGMLLFAAHLSRRALTTHMPSMVFKESDARPRLLVHEVEFAEVAKLLPY